MCTITNRPQALYLEILIQQAYSTTKSNEAFKFCTYVHSISCTDGNRPIDFVVSVLVFNKTTTGPRSY